MAFFIRVAAIVVVLLTAPEALQAQRPYTANTFTQSEDQALPAASIKDVAWIAVHWQGEALGGTAEEVWNPPLGGAMMGMFKLVREEEIAFYEILSLTPEDETLVLALRHFNADLTAWEEKDETIRFPLVKLVSDAAYFDKMTFRRISQDTLQIFLAITQSDGSVREAEFLYHRIPNGDSP